MKRDPNRPEHWIKDPGPLPVSNIKYRSCWHNVTHFLLGTACLVGGAAVGYLVVLELWGEFWAMTVGLIVGAVAGLMIGAAMTRFFEEPEEKPLSE